MVKKGPVHYRKYTNEFKVEAIRLGESIGVSSAPKRLGISDGNLRNWIHDEVVQGNWRLLRWSIQSRERCQKWRQRISGCVENWRARSWIWKS